MSKKKQKFKVHPNKFSLTTLQQSLSGFSELSGYSFTKRHNRNEYDQIINLLPIGYVSDKINELECVDFIYSGSAQSPFLLTIAAGRNDRFQNAEKFDIDVFNIAPHTNETAFYFEHQWHHFRDEYGNRTSIDIHPFPINDQLQLKDLTYATYLTGSTAYFSLDDYKQERPEFFEIHKQCFKNLNV